MQKWFLQFWEILKGCTKSMKCSNEKKIFYYKMLKLHKNIFCVKLAWLWFQAIFILGSFIFILYDQGKISMHSLLEMRIFNIAKINYLQNLIFVLQNYTWFGHNYSKFWSENISRGSWRHWRLIFPKCECLGLQCS